MDSDTFVIEKASPAFKVEITKDIVAFDEGVEINVTLPVDATGNVAIFVDGKHIASGMPVNGIFNVTLSPDILASWLLSWKIGITKKEWPMETSK